MKKILLFIIILCFFKSGFCSQTYCFDVKKEGKGENAIIFLPGFASSGDVWNETAEHYKNNFSCYILTMHGFAGAKADSNASISLWVRSIGDFIKEKKLNKPIVIGHSLGGVMALSLGANYPDLISKIVVVDALPCLSALSNPNFKVSEHPDCSVFVRAFTAPTNEAFYKNEKLMAASLVSDTAQIQTIVQWGMSSDRNIMANMYCNFLNTDLRPELSKITCPVLLLMETNFKQIKESISDQYKNLKTAKMEFSTKGLHFIMYDDKPWYFQQLNSFLL